MKKFTLFLCLTAFFCGCMNDNGPKNNSTASAKVSEMKKSEQQLRHVVLFKFKEGTTKEAIQNVENAFIDLPSKIAQIRDFEWGTNNSPEGLDKGFTHCFFVTFGSEADREIYLPHPDHKAFVEVLSPHLEDVLVLDYWVK